MSGLFDFVLVTADLRASEESIDGKSSIIGRILERSVDRAAADDEIAKIVEESRAKQQQVYEEKFKAQLDAITTQLNEVVRSYSPGRAVTVSPAEVELKAPRTTFDVAVLDGTTSTVVERQGHGFQRTLLISALQLLAQSGAASAEGVICLAIEEPELFQHPIQAQAFAKVLRSLAEDAGKRIQVTYATHSPYFLEARHFDQVRRLTRSADTNPAVAVHFATVDDVKAKLSGTVDADQVARQLDGIVTNRLAVTLFAARALLVEGDTEAAVFYGIGDRDAVGRLESQGLSIVSACGKGGIPLAHAILVSLGIPTYVLFDGDSGFEARAKTVGKTQSVIEGEHTKFSTENRRLLKYLGEPEVDFPLERVGDRVATLSDHLESYLESNWSEWITSCAAIEAAAGIQLSKNQYAYRTATLEAKGTAPDLLKQILAKAGGA
jgi:putative ATP-dependent endonuclease of the OLD family